VPYKQNDEETRFASASVALRTALYKSEYYYYVT